MKKLLWQKLIAQILLVSLSIFSGVGKPLPAWSAERIRFYYGPLGFSLSLDSLEKYAARGEIDKELKFYANKVDEQTLNQLSQILNRRIKFSSVALYRFTRSPLGAKLIKSLGQVITTHLGSNGFYPLRGALVMAAAEQGEQGFTLLDVLRQFPTQELWLDTRRLFELRDELTDLVEYRQAIAAAISARAERDAAIGVKADYAPMQDLRQPGKIQFTEQTLVLDNQHHTHKSRHDASKFRVKLYLPQGLTQPAPVAILSHGFLSEPESFDYLSEHLASHGIAAVAVEHVGSDSDNELAIFEGRKSRAINPREFIERPLDIQYVLDELERLSLSDPKFRGKLDLAAIGVVGHSLGGYTALALGGAPINLERLDQHCPKKNITLNISLILQCRARNGANFVERNSLQEPRIKGIMAINPMTSTIFGPESLAKIKLPTLIVAGDRDFVTPMIQEQVYPFTWLTAPNKYLALLIPGDHFISSSFERAEASSVISQSRVFDRQDTQPSLYQEIAGANSASANGRPYLKALTLAFMKAKISNNQTYIPYLSASYGKAISTAEVDLNLIESLSSEELEQFLNSPPPSIQRLLAS